MTRRFLALAAAGVVAVGCSHGADVADTWRVLQAQLIEMPASGRSAAIQRFVDDRHGTPIIEDDTRLVFLVEHDSDVPPRVVGDFNAWAAIPGGIDPRVGIMQRVGGTNWWWLEGTARSDARIEYVVFMTPSEVRPDPLNARQVDAYAGPRSEVRMPEWIAQPEIDDEAAVPAGAVSMERFVSSALGGSRRVWYYRPPGYAISGETRYPSVYFLDGGNYVEMDVPRVLDRLIARRVIPPVVAVFVEPDDRIEEYGASGAWRAFMASELVPAVSARYRTVTSASSRVILGSSFGAVGAIRLTLDRPDIFGRVAALAPPDVAVTALESAAQGASPGTARRWFVLGGVYDHLLGDAHRLMEGLDGLAEPLTYLEVPEGHSTETFRGHLDDALRVLLAGQATDGSTVHQASRSTFPGFIVAARRAGRRPQAGPVVSRGKSWPSARR